jgi:hypothetical protein
MSAPRRGEVWLVDLGMAAKVRPALVISVPAADTDRALVTLVPHTTVPDNRDSKQSSRCHFRERACSMRRISSRFRTRNWYANSENSRQAN